MAHHEIIIKFGICFGDVEFNDIPKELQAHTEEHGQEHNRIFGVYLHCDLATYGCDEALDFKHVLADMKNIESMAPGLLSDFEKLLNTLGIEDHQAVYDLFHTPKALIMLERW